MSKIVQINLPYPVVIEPEPALLPVEIFVLIYQLLFAVRIISLLLLLVVFFVFRKRKKKWMLFTLLFCLIVFVVSFFFEYLMFGYIDLSKLTR